jgi:hypothetical protein
MEKIKNFYKTLEKDIRFRIAFVVLSTVFTFGLVLTLSYVLKTYLPVPPIK